MNQKQKWGAARDSVYPRVNEVLKENGYQEVTLSVISPKTLRSFQKSNHAIIRDWEFDGKKLFVFFNDDWNQLIDKDGNSTDRLMIYTLQKTPNYKDIYKQFSIDESQGEQSIRFEVPIEDFNFLCGEKARYAVPIEKKQVDAQPGFVSRLNKKSAVVESTSKIMFPTEEEVEMSFATGTEIEDELIKNQSYRDYLTMRYLVPVSTKPWLNKVVKQIHEELYGK
jgi:hypothetical protein